MNKEIVKKTKYISLDAIRTKREALLKKRNDFLLDQNYAEADEVLKDIHVINFEYNEMLKKEYGWSQ
jgi:uncharacterized protein (DUF1778 family)